MLTFKLWSDARHLHAHGSGVAVRTFYCLYTGILPYVN